MILLCFQFHLMLSSFVRIYIFFSDSVILAQLKSYAQTGPLTLVVLLMAVEVAYVEVTRNVVGLHLNAIHQLHLQLVPRVTVRFVANPYPGVYLLVRPEQGLASVAHHQIVAQHPRLETDVLHLMTQVNACAGRVHYAPPEVL